MTDKNKNAELAPAAPKRWIFLRWGNVIFLVLMVVFTLLIIATNPLVAFLSLNAFYASALGLLILTIVRIAKKYRRFWSYLWLFSAPFVTFLLIMAWLTPPVQRVNESRISSTREDVSCPINVIKREPEDLSLQKESYVEETIYHDFTVAGDTKKQVFDGVEKCFQGETVSNVLGLQDVITRTSSKEAFAFNYSSIIWHFERGMQGEECRPTWVAVRLYADTYMPKLTTANSSLMSEWNKYIKKVQIHEDGHRDIAGESSKSFRDTLMAMTAPDCDKLKKNMEQKINEFSKELQRKEDIFDVQTDHGVKQGVVF